MLEGFWIRNFKSLKQVGIGTCFPQFTYVDDEENLFPYELDSATLFTGACGTGKSTIVDAFSFVSDCFHHGVDFACIKRGGFDAIYSQDGKGSLSFGFLYREKGEPEPVTYALSIECVKNKAPYIESELLAYRGVSNSVPIFFLQNGMKSIRYLAPDERIGTSELTKIEFTDYKHLGLAALESHPKFPVIGSLRNLFENWVLSNFTTDPARGLDNSLPRRHDSPRGVSLSGLIRFNLERYENDLESLVRRITNRMPNVETFYLDRSQEGKPFLTFKLYDLEKPVPITQVSDATIRLFAYSLLLEEDYPAPLIVLEEPENGLDRLHCWKLMEQIQRVVDFPRAMQMFATSHHPGLADLLHPAQVWILEKGKDGYTIVERASDSLLLQPDEDDPDAAPPLRWFSDNFEERL